MKNIAFGVIISTMKSEGIYCTMMFIEAYKRLEKLCGEILDDDRRISAYIDEMRNTPRGARFVSGWNEDLKQLKHYRWVRNQIAHDPGCSEENMCDDDDTQWIVDFYARIMNQTDPLAIYRKATQKQMTKGQDSQKENDDEAADRLVYFISSLIVAAGIIAILCILR